MKNHFGQLAPVVFVRWSDGAIGSQE